MIDEEHQSRGHSPSERVDKMLELIGKKFGRSDPEFILCILAERKNSDIYGMAL